MPFNKYDYRFLWLSNGTNNAHSNTWSISNRQSSVWVITLGPNITNNNNNNHKERKKHTHNLIEIHSTQLYQQTNTHSYIQCNNCFDKHTVAIYRVDHPFWMSQFISMNNNFTAWKRKNKPIIELRVDDTTTTAHMGRLQQQQ